jgi:hypothetical protein
MNHTCWCDCGNLSVTGRVLSSHEIPKQLQSGTIMTGSAKCFALAIRLRAIEIKNTGSTNIVQQENNQCTVTCRSCGQSISFIDSAKHGYAVLNKKTRHVRRQSNPLQNTEIKQNLKKYIKDEETFEGFEPIFLPSSAPSDDIPQAADCNEEEIDFVDEGDFEYMFSGKSDPFIGSFRDHFIYNPSKQVFV